jgi:hypothetical protein
VIGAEYVTVSMFYYLAVDLHGEENVYLLQAKTALTLMRPDIENIPGRLSPVRLVHASA